MPKITLMRGLPASGKSTLARELCSRQPGRTVRVNMDSIRAMLGLEYSRDAEQLALKLQDAAVLAALRAGNDVVVDNCHINDAWPRRLATLVWESGITCTWSVVDLTAVSMAECEDRNHMRSLSPLDTDSAAVPDHVIPKMAKELGRKSPWTIESIHRGLPEIVPVVRDYSLPEAAIVDMDGTLCDSAGLRGPYDFDKCGDDLLHQEVLDFVGAWADLGKVLICTGRDSKYRITCRKWLEDNSVPYDELFMRPAGDTRRDSVVKLNLFNDNIRGKYNVVAAWDDRLRVCKIWHNLGISVFRCGDPSADF